MAEKPDNVIDGHFDELAALRGKPADVVGTVGGIKLDFTCLTFGDLAELKDGFGIDLLSPPTQMPDGFDAAGFIYQVFHRLYRQQEPGADETVTRALLRLKDIDTIWNLLALQLWGIDMTALAQSAREGEAPAEPDAPDPFPGDESTAPSSSTEDSPTPNSGPVPLVDSKP